MNSKTLKLYNQFQELEKELRRTAKQEMEQFLVDKRLDKDVIVDDNGQEYKGRIKVVESSFCSFTYDFKFYPYKKDGTLSVKSKYVYLGNFYTDYFEETFNKHWCNIRPCKDGE